MPDDYAELERRGVSVKGRIVLTRYGGGWRGLKPKLAYEHGAVGCLIYSDPRDDGYGKGDTYPNPSTLSLHDALPISAGSLPNPASSARPAAPTAASISTMPRSS
jgi:hypothetical protein